MGQASELTEYFREAASWDQDREALNARSSRRAWQVAGVALALASLAILALALAMPLKRVEPFVIRVDNTSGVVDLVPVYRGGAPMSETVTRYFLTHYVMTCERFNFATAESDYEECGAFHTPARNQLWYAQWNPNNAASPLNVHKDGSSVRAEVESVSFFKRASGLIDLAQVRYRRAESQGDAPPRITHWIASIQSVYGEAPKDP